MLAFKYRVAQADTFILVFTQEITESQNPQMAKVGRDL